MMTDDEIADQVPHEIQAGPSASVLRLITDAATNADPRPKIRLGAELDDARRQCDAALADPNVYHNGTSLVHVVDDPIAGGPAIRRLTTAALRSKLAAVAVFEKLHPASKQWKPTKAPTDVAQALADWGAWEHVRPLRGIMESPFLRRDCSVVVESGYDLQSGYLYLPSVNFGDLVDLVDAPTRDDAARALKELAEVFCDFPFASTAARYVPIAALLTVIARPAIDGAVPGFAFDASAAGSGKTLQTDAIAFIASGRDASKMSLAPDDVELEKVLGAYAMAGAQLVAFDNAATGAAVGGAPLDRVLSARDRVSLRVLGRTEVPELPWRAVVLISGNNISFRGDTWRRVLISRLEPQIDNPEDRSDFAHPDLIGWVREERARLVRAALVVLRAFVVAGKPRKVARMGSFEAWSDFVACAIVYAGGPNVLETRPKVTDSTDEGAALAVILDRMPAIMSTNGITAAEIVHTLYSTKQLRGEAPPDGYDDLREAIEVLAPARPGSAPSTRALGGRFRSLKGRVLGGKKLVPVDGRAGVARWKIGGAS